MTEITEIFENFDWLGGIIVYFCTFAIKPFVRQYIIQKYQDLILLIIAIIFSFIYAFLTDSALKGFEAFAGSQVIHALVKKGLISWIGQK